MIQPGENKELERLLVPGLLRSKNIIIAEDDETNFYLLKEYLEFSKANIIWCKDGKETVEKVEVIKEPDMILMDIRMPILNGYDALKIIRKKHPEIPIIAITAYAINGDRERGLKAGFNEYLPKPVSHKVLMETILKFLV